ncbi:MAG: argininosuccinate lyase [Gammaproteobacteria bacterium]|nr:argininosuccinate lyase [Gammaproteobacteria bacterium]MDH3465176.1 argininosuccinate lyase [Gammaproteobacteria bacterium]
MSKPKLWGGRFSGSTDEVVEAFTASVDVDRRLYPHDITASIAHARMLGRVEVITTAESETIIKGLEDIESEISAGTFIWSDALEDVHMNIEAALTERIGEVGKKLHTARSRNDQVATDMRLFVRDRIDHHIQGLRSLQLVLVNIAEREADTLMPGFTHMQPAQPVTFGHHLLAWTEMLERDCQRFVDCRRRVNISPLGSAALAGTGFPIDRAAVAADLDFDGVSENSLDAVSDRDFVMEFISVAAVLMIHLSRIAEELVLWSSTQFGFIDLGDAFCTGSSIMPQKKNPDVAELIRGKCARVSGALMSVLMLMKSQPLAYNRDNQEDKAPVFDATDTASICVDVLGRMLAQMTPNREVMRDAALKGYTTATDLADYLVRKQVAFRDAHAIVGRVVRHALEHETPLTGFDLATFQQFCPKIDEDVFAVLDPQGSVDSRSHIGGTAPVRVREAVERARARFKH